MCNDSVNFFFFFFSRKHLFKHTDSAVLTFFCMWVIYACHCSAVLCVFQASCSGQWTPSVAQSAIHKVSRTFWVSPLPSTPSSPAATAMETLTSLRYKLLSPIFTR